MSGFMEMWDQMGFLAKAIVLVLGIMSVWSISVMIERYLKYWAARTRRCVTENEMPGVSVFRSRAIRWAAAISRPCCWCAPCRRVIEPSSCCTRKAASPDCCTARPSTTSFFHCRRATSGAVMKPWVMQRSWGAIRRRCFGSFTGTGSISCMVTMAG